MTLKIIRNDITNMNVDVIVNTANEKPTYSTGLDFAVYQKAGVNLLLKERQKIGPLKEGDVAITPGFQLPAKYIIHAISPDFRKGDKTLLLHDCYRKSLFLAKQYQCTSIAMPLISTGNFGCSKEEGMRIALDEINAFLLQNDMLVYLVVFDENATKLGTQLYPDLESYIDAHYVEQQLEIEYPKRRKGNISCGASVSLHRAKRSDLYAERSSNEMSETICEDSYDGYIDFVEKSESALKERMSHMSDTFVEYLMFLIDKKQLSNAQVYKRAIITKQLFSKIKLNVNYHPDKSTAMRLCVGAMLSLDETKDLLARAGYALSPCDKRDIIFSFFIEHEVYDMIEIDIALEEHGLDCFIQ